jgi:hypothetical protein
MKSKEELDDLVDGIVVDAYNDDEQLSAFDTVIGDEVTLPADASVVGEPVTVIKIAYDGNERRGLTAQCRREDGSEYTVAACDLVFPEGSKGSDYIAAYRRWLGIEPYPKVSSRKKPKAKKEDLVVGKKADLVALAIKGNAVSCRIVGTDRVLTFRPAGFFEGVPGEIITVIPSKIWQYGGHPYVSGEITAWRTDVPGLGLIPLTLEEQGMWDPTKQYWGEPVEPWARPMIKKGVRLVYRMELILPGWDLDDPDSDLIIKAVELEEAGDYKKAHRALMDLLAADLRCLDAHAHLGNFAFDHDPDTAVRHYDMGVKIGELSLGKDFGGLLPWGFIENRPFLRCLHGYGLCMWRFGRLRDAEKVFTHILWLNPDDNQDVRAELSDVKEGEVWDG